MNNQSLPLKILTVIQNVMAIVPYCQDTVFLNVKYQGVQHKHNTRKFHLVFIFVLFCVCFTRTNKRTEEEKKEHLTGQNYPFRPRMMSET